ncbi:hypothetical protein [Pseudomonas wenzhouensis]|uniref:hypothetical protein n=1 Tax=Pseudomonas wenzhouensis TaxID=2906062 RepID=UPI001E58CCC6|nr:hypothetical protein [Pseudomonas wenzhouensis]UFQ96968.1 hypothetical protein J7655_17015 [Pseudomonas wenzhouensis]
MDGHSAFQGDTDRIRRDATLFGGEGQGWDLRTQNCSSVRHTLVKFVKTVFFTLFWSGEPQKLDCLGALLPVQNMQCMAAIGSAYGLKSDWPEWQREVGDSLGRGDDVASARSCGPIRRRPYNRGAIITVNEGKLIAPV